MSNEEEVTKVRAITAFNTQTITPKAHAFGSAAISDGGAAGQKLRTMRLVVAGCECGLNGGWNGRGRSSTIG